MLSKDLKESKKINRITIKSQLEHLTALFIIIFFGTLMSCVVYLNDGFQIFIFVVIALSLITILVLFIHIQYLITNRSYKISICDENKLLCNIGDKEVVITNENIICIEKNISYNINGPQGNLPTASYYYSKLILKNGDIIIITSLLMPDFDFFKDKTRIKKRFIAIII